MRLLLARLRVVVPMIWAATLAGYFGGIWWPLELACHFRVQYCVLFVVMGAILAAAKRFRWAGVAFLGAVVNLWFIVPLYLGDVPRNARGQSIRMVSLNLNFQNRDHEKLTEFVNSNGAHVVLLMEVNEHWRNRITDLSDSYPHSIAHVQEGNFGMALLSRIPFIRTEIELVGDFDFPMLVALPAIQDKPLSVIGAHPPPPVSSRHVSMREEYLEELARCVSRQLGNVVVLGDLNTTSWSPLFKSLLRKTGLRDSRRGFGVQPTWPVFIPPLLIPIDHCLVSPDISVIHRCTGPNVGSDHYPLVVDLEPGKH